MGSIPFFRSRWVSLQQPIELPHELFMRTIYYEYETINPRAMEKGTKRNQPSVSDDVSFCVLNFLYSV
jgi:hypothetical protein